MRFSRDYKNVMTLMSGTTLSQIIPIIATVFIARLYSSYEFGEIELFLRMSTFLIVFSTLRYELAIPLPKIDQHAFYLFEYTFRWNVVFFVLFQLVITGLYFGFAYYSIDYSFSSFYLWLPLFVFLLAYTTQSENWALRQEKFRLLSYSRILNSLSVNSFKILFGILSFGAVGLIVGNIIGTIAGALTYTKNNIKAFRTHISYSEKTRRLVSARQFRDFPYVNAPHALTDMGKEILIIILMTYYFGLEIVGLYSFALKIIRIPISLIGIAFGQVFYQKASGLINEKKSIKKFSLRNARDLFLISVIPTSILFFYGEGLFVFAFGEGWRYAGYLAEINAPALLILFLSSPLSRIPMLLGEQRMFFLISTIFSVFYLLILYLGSSYYSLDFTSVWIALSIFQFVYLGLIILWYFQVIKKYEKRIKLS
jgi:O-antigen/teichoic acid export membrane protein